MTQQSACLQSLEEINRPATAKEVYEHIVSNNYFSFNGPKPEYYISTRLIELCDIGAVGRTKEAGGTYLYYIKNRQNIGTSTPTYYKIAPGSQATEWDKFYNENIIAINFSDINTGDLSVFNSWEELNETVGKTKSSNETKNLWEFKTANQSDIIFVNKGVDTCIGIGIIEGDYYYEETADTFKHRRNVKWLTNKIYQYEAFTFRDYKTLFRPDTFTRTNVGDFLLNEYVKYYPELASIFDKNGINIPALSKNDIKHNSLNQEINMADSYSFLEDLDKPFMSEQDFYDMIALLKRKKNIILGGPPGVGKTFIARKIAYEVMHQLKDANIEMVQFHQSYSYEDFIQGLRPTKGGFDLRKGIFYSFCEKANKRPDEDFFFIIDEINRGNLSKIFGELMMLIEADKRDKKYALNLTYSESEEDKFYVPKNLYIIGTMNTADRSLALVDYALRRRFAFCSLHPKYDQAFKSFLKEKGVSTTFIELICSKITKVNDHITEDKNLGPAFQIGHSYFCSFNSNESQDENKWWDEILKFELQPLLAEIWFDDSSKVNDMINILSL